MPSVLLSTSTPDELAALPLAALQRRVRLRDVAGHGEHHGHRVLAGRYRVALRGVGHDDALRCGRWHVYVVDAHAGTADDLQVFAGLDNLFGDLGLAADNECVIVLDLLDQLLLGELGLDVDLHTRLGLQDFNTFFGNWVCNKDFHDNYPCMGSRNSNGLCMLISFWIKAGDAAGKIYNRSLEISKQGTSMAEVVTARVETQAVTHQHSLAQNVGALALAMVIDFADAIPSELLFALGLVPIPVGYEAGVSVVEAAYLNYLGVPIVKLLAVSGADLLPFIDVIPWCTLAVLDTRFGLKIPLVTRLFNY